ncbi:hypothetical protein P3X46_015890 [Hevea brasiliensis]|uniref:Protein TSSC4 n=1 Tax=Hevea brasiliensis TaxID=3981 RepID=A0ABQ9LZL9_HEVBR|nr:uncharacterized protein LOC110641134 [Hevea brasiliensis]KAJ9172677.1 hypothetical protein P3X46_015890 [Hevea brasiliensis]
METPSSTKRVTRSQTFAGLIINNIPISRKIEVSERGVSTRRSGKQEKDRSALIDITNDSPIVGLAMGSLETPSSAVAKQRSNRVKNNNTPSSGEALLRGQVKTLLQEVEEEAELSKISLENRPFVHIQGFVSSPMGLLAPTPANTPQVPNLSEDDRCISNTPLPVVEEQLQIFQVVNDIFDEKEEGLESQKSITRSLMLDFSEKSEITNSSSECSSVVTTCKVDKSSTTDDDSSSNWSIHVNASTHDEDEEEQEIEEEEDYDPYDYEEGDYGGSIDALCEGIGKVSVSESKTAPAKFTGKHTRFRYNSDDEIVEEEVIAAPGSSPSVLHLKGLPTSKGKHFRFPKEEED